MNLGLLGWDFRQVVFNQQLEAGAFARSVWGDRPGQKASLRISNKANPVFWTYCGTTFAGHHDERGMNIFLL